MRGRRDRSCRPGGVAVKFATRSVALDLDVQLPSRTAVEGSAIEAIVRGIARRDVAVNSGEAELVRTVAFNYRQGLTNGPGSILPPRRSEVVSRQVLPATGRLAAGQPLTQQVTLAVPADAPGSAATELVTVSWAVRVRLGIEGSRDEEVSQGIVVLSRARSRASAAQGPPLGEDHGCAALGFESISSRILVPGSHLSGLLTVAPRRRVSARDLRLDLVLLEHVHHGPWIGDNPARAPSDPGQEAETVAASVQLAHRLELDPAQPLRFPFTLPVPPGLQAPSIQEPQYSLTWVLRGVLNVRLHQDPYVEAEMQGVTAKG